MQIVDALIHALTIAGTMTWQILWALILGFCLSAIVQAVVRRESIRRLLGDDRPKTLAIAAGFGIASSSCSYAAVALARSLFRKGANFTAAMAFEIASTNLVIELGIIMALLLGWQFTLAEFIGGPLMIIMLAVLFRIFLSQRLLNDASVQSERGLAGSMEGHATMDMSVKGDGTLWQRLWSSAGFTSVSHVFVMEWAAVIRDIALGLLIAGAVAAWVPETFWQNFFFVSNPVWSKIWGPLVGPLVSVVSFVCSIGNVPLAAVLWNGGISFGGVISFIFADLIIIPILVIYRKYYGPKMMLFILWTFYATMVAAGYLVEIIFAVLHLTPTIRNATVLEPHISWNYTTVLNLFFLALAVILIWRFYRTGGRSMLAMMNGSPDDMPMEHTHHH